jgi:hydrogenase maturation protease
MIRLIGYGNPGRGDDGLGPALAAHMADLPEVSVTSDYQLTVDHALLIADARIVVFADALMHADTPYEFHPVDGSTAGDVTSHSLSPQAVLGLCHTLYQHTPQAFVLGITGHDFGEVKEGLSPIAQSNLTLATTFLSDWFLQHTVGGRTHA